jgi:hypothetical protein
VRAGSISPPGWRSHLRAAAASIACRRCSSAVLLGGGVPTNPGSISIAAIARGSWLSSGDDGGIAWSAVDEVASPRRRPCPNGRRCRLEGCCCRLRFLPSPLNPPLPNPPPPPPKLPPPPPPPLEPWLPKLVGLLRQGKQSTQAPTSFNLKINGCTVNGARCTGALNGGTSCSSVSTRSGRTGSSIDRL